MAIYDHQDPSIIPAADDNGTSAKLTVRVPPEWLRQIDTVIKYKKIDYVNRGDFVRDAIRRHFQWVETWLRGHEEECYGSLLGKINMILRELEQDRYLQGFHSVVLSLKERVGVFLRRGAEKEALRHILRSLQIINQMPESYWKKVYKKTIEEEYKDLLNSDKHKIDLYTEEEGDY